MKKLTWKKVVLSFIYGILGVCVIPVVAYFFPFPIEGNWLNPWTISCGCKRERGCHSFLRFEDGKILWMSNTHFPPDWIGTYTRKGWGKYETEEFGSDCPPSVVYSSYLRIATSGAWRCSRIFRDPFSACREAVNNSSNDWMSVWDGASYRITGTPEERIFSAHCDITKEEMEEMLNYTFRQPLQIHTAGNEVPSSVIETLIANGIDYTVHTNQEWIVSDTSQTNPVWAVAANQTAFCLIITPPPEKAGYGVTEHSIYLMRKKPYDLGEFAQTIKYHRWKRDYYKNRYRLYAENSVVPEDVKHLFDQFDIEYTVLDEKELYRGKRKETK